MARIAEVWTVQPSVRPTQGQRSGRQPRPANPAPFFGTNLAGLGVNSTEPHAIRNRWAKGRRYASIGSFVRSGACAAPAPDTASPLTFPTVAAKAVDHDS